MFGFHPVPGYLIWAQSRIRLYSGSSDTHLVEDRSRKNTGTCHTSSGLKNASLQRWQVIATVDRLV